MELCSEAAAALDLPVHAEGRGRAHDGRPLQRRGAEEGYAPPRSLQKITQSTATTTATSE